MGQDVLFVINEAVTLSEVNLMQEMCLYLGITPSFYDISMHGTLNLFAPLPHLQSTLVEDLRGKTLVLINREYTVSATSQDPMLVWSLLLL